MRESIYKGIQRFKLENTQYVIKFIKNDPELLRECRAVGMDGLEEYCFNYAYRHGEEFGNRLVTELYDVFWRNVWYGIKEKNNARTA